METSKLKTKPQQEITFSEPEKSFRIFFQTHPSNIIAGFFSFFISPSHPKSNFVIFFFKVRSDLLDRLYLALIACDHFLMFGLSDRFRKVQMRCYTKISTTDDYKWNNILRIDIVNHIDFIDFVRSIR